MDKLKDEKGNIPEETKEFHKIARRRLREQYIKDTAPKTDNRDYFAPQDETDVFTALGKKKKYPAPNEWLRTGEVPGVKLEQEGKNLADYIFEAPKTYPQVGATNVEDQATLQEMQKALPDVDMKSEYETDPEMMKKLIELWRTKKLTKQNLHKAFSMIQQTAQQSLGIG
jgi:hypothetical protein